MRPKTAGIFMDVAGGLAHRVGATRVGDALHNAHAQVAGRLDGFLQRDLFGTEGRHIPMPGMKDGRLHVSPWTKDRQSHIRQVLSNNPEAMPLMLAGPPGATEAYLGAKGIARRVAGVPLSGVPGTTSSVRQAVSGVLPAAAAGAKRVGSSLRDFMSKENSMSNKTASGPEYRGRNPEAVSGLATERGNIASGNAVLDGLFARKAEMADRTEKQLSVLFKNPSYGRNRALGPTAAEASSYLGRARAAGVLG